MVNRVFNNLELYKTSCLDGNQRQGCLKGAVFWLLGNQCSNTGTVLILVGESYCSVNCYFLGVMAPFLVVSTDLVFPVWTSLGTRVTLDLVLVISE